MNKSDLKNGMSFKTRNNNWYDIIRSEIFKTAYEEYSLKYEATLKVFLSHYSDDLKNIHSNKFDIIEVYDIDGKLIWERDKVDWSKIPRDTKVLVRNSKDEEWQRKHFAEYKNGKVFTYDYGTSWNTSLITTWEYAKLVEEPKKEMIVSAKDLHKAFRTMCESHPRCDCCDYNYSVGTCEFKWILDNYNVTRKE